MANAIRDVNELLQQLRTYPLALADLAFIMSQALLLKESHDAVLQIFDQHQNETKDSVIVKTLRNNLQQALRLEYFDDEAQ